MPGEKSLGETPGLAAGEAANQEEARSGTAVFRERGCHELLSRVFSQASASRASTARTQAPCGQGPRPVHHLAPEPSAASGTQAQAVTLDSWCEAYPSRPARCASSGMLLKASLLSFPSSKMRIRAPRSSLGGFRE